MFEVLFIGLAFVAGLLVRRIGLPPLVGFLAAGFVLHAIQANTALVPHYTGEVLSHTAHLGVLLLLFTVGLKLRLAQLVQPQVIGGGLMHFALSVAILAPAFLWVGELTISTAVLLGVALAFSSTVLAAKILEGKKELASFHGRVAIGILIIQDLIALGVLSLSAGQSPSPWALGLLALPLLRPLFHWLLDASGRDELLVLMGMLLALVVGGAGFAALGLSGEVGALMMGVLLAGHKRAKEVAQALWGLKEVFLVGFFLQIGMSGLPTLNDALFALGMVALLPVKGAFFFLILTTFRLRARNAFLAAAALTAYSEFGLIVAAGIPALEPWLVPLALTVAISFVVAAPLNYFSHSLFEKMEALLMRFERHNRHPDEMVPDLGQHRALVMGMGRTGTAAYDTLSEQIDSVIGLEYDPYKVADQVHAGRHVVLADAGDSDFWKLVQLDKLEVAVLTLDDIDAKVMAARKLRERGFRGPIISHALFQDHVALVREAGADHTYLTMHEAGRHLAGHALSCITSADKEEPSAP
jgi:predicted Kef-type K+ transport protein